MGGDDVSVAEYVLGVLDTRQHADMAARIATDPVLQAEKTFWERQLSGLDEQFAEAPAPAAVLGRIEKRLFGTEPKPSIWQSLALWRGIALGSVAAATLALGLTIMRPAPVVPGEGVQLAASLQAEDSNVKFLALYDSMTGNVKLAALSGEEVPDRDFELWIIEGDDAPVSLGVVPVNAPSSVPLTEAQRQTISTGTVFAVTLEPKGGSPDGNPTGPVVAAGAVSVI